MINPNAQHIEPKAYPLSEPSTTLDGLLQSTKQEHGSKDWRMLLFMLVVWLSSLLTLMDYQQHHSRLVDVKSVETYNSIRSSFTPGIMSAIVIDVILVISAIMIYWFTMSGKKTKKQYIPGKQVIVFKRLRKRISYIMFYLVVLSCIGLISVIASFSALLIQESDVAYNAATQVSNSVQAHVDVVTPMVVSERPSYDCRVDIKINAMRFQNVISSSNAKARLYAKKSDCLFKKGEQYSVKANISPSTFGAAKLWLTITTDTAQNNKYKEAYNRQIQLLKPAYKKNKIINNLQESFLEISSSLDNQGQILVPGLTLGIMGHESLLPQNKYSNKTTNNNIDSSYANHIKTSFKQAGIMHLMAVSGGHFLLISGCIRRFLKLLRAPNFLQSCVIIIALGLLADAMYPSDSVTRAYRMGIFTTFVMATGRKAQSISILSWTCIWTILLEPALSQSFGFALSCASVLAIVIGAKSFTAFLKSHMPKCIAQPLAITVLAQIATLPIQIVMSGQVSLFSPIANLIVEPFVDFATVCGLLGLLLSHALPMLASIFARFASWGTYAMFRTATYIAGTQINVIPWPSGCFGALMVILFEITAYACIRVIISLNKLRHMPENVNDLNSQEVKNYQREYFYQPTLWQKINLWWIETWNLLKV